MKDEALKLALDALENSVDLVREDAYNAEKLYGNYPSRQGKVAGLKVLADAHEKAITAIKQALAAPVQEPVAWRYDLKHAGSFAGVSREYSPIKLSIGENWTPLYTTPPNVATPLAAQPTTEKSSEVQPAAQRQWVWLTDDDIEQEFGFIDELLRDCVHRTEAKVRSKNELL